MNQEEEIEYWKEKYRILKLSMQTAQKNEERMHKFKMVSMIEDLLKFISYDLRDRNDEDYEKLKYSQTAVTKWKVNQELGVDYFELEK